MDVQQLKDDAAASKLTVDRLILVIEAQQKRIAELEELIKAKNPTDRLDKPYSQDAEQKRNEKEKNKGKGRKRKTKPLRRGRLRTADKIKLAERTEQVFPEGVPATQCRLSHTRVMWRLENGRAVLVAYEIFRSGNQFGKPAGAIGRGEFGIEVIVALAYQVFCLGLSIDKACAVLSFFQQLKLRNSQADALLNQLAAAWEGEFDHLCTLLAHSAVMHTDETS